MESSEFVELLVPPRPSHIAAQVVIKRFARRLRTLSPGQMTGSIVVVIGTPFVGKKEINAVRALSVREMHRAIDALRKVGEQSNAVVETGLQAAIR